MAPATQKLYYKIGEVCQICQIEPHVLRYWETEFSMLSPAKNKSGQRIYRHKELELVQSIRYLLYDQGYTLAGANKRLKEQGPVDEAARSGPQLSSSQKKALSEARNELQAALEVLSRNPSE